ncbi:protodermal factor 1 [Quercus suber]|uniref:Protodermal factor 1 n=1 Tax=Quercus suber TaxID=58331 RepID=A0AAW0LPJ6_QUESU|nr:protodermal factor 1 [Quercus suber]POE79246.1 protodermal factor 1 [Quercus suber]
MERQTSKFSSMFTWTLVAALLSQNLVMHVVSTSFEDQKNYFYFPPDPHFPRGSPPITVSPPYVSTPPPDGGYGTPPPHGGTPPSHGGTPPSHGGTPPSHGNPPHHGGHSPKPPSPSNCGTPPHHDPTPSTPSTPSGGGGYYNSPPTSQGSPPTPIIETPPSTTTPPPSPLVPTPPFLPDPNSPIIGTCTYWRTHPGIIWGLLGWWGTMGNAFGVTSVPGFGAHLTLQQALSNTRTDGLGALYREGTASLLNSMVNNRFPFTTKQVRESFMAALSSNKAAAAQAHLFKQANEGKLKPRD